MINLASKQKFLIVEYMLEKKEFTQYQVKKDLKTGMSIVNQTFKFLLDKGVIKQKLGKYVLADAQSLIELLAFFRNMNDLKLLELGTSLDKKNIIKLFPEKTVFCMETALEHYSNYYKSNVVSAYADEKTAKEIEKKFLYSNGNKTLVVLYKEKPLLTKKEVKFNKIKITSMIKTIIDLYCAKRGNEAHALVKHLWE